MAKVIHPAQLPTRLPGNTTLLYVLALSYFQAPAWMWWVTLTLLGVLWILSVYSMWTDKYTSIRL